MSIVLVPVVPVDEASSTHNAITTMLHHTPVVRRLVINMEFVPNVALSATIHKVLSNQRTFFCLWQSNSFLFATAMAATFHTTLASYLLVTSGWPSGI